MPTEFAVGDIVKIKSWDELVKNDANIPESYQAYAGKVCTICEIDDRSIRSRFTLRPILGDALIEKFFILGDFDFLSFSYLSKSLGNIALIYASQTTTPAHETRLELKRNA